MVTLDVTIRAVVFDLYGTLVPEFPLAEWDAMFEAMAGALGVAPPGFRREWDATIVERQTGGFTDVEENLRFITGRMGAAPSQGAVARALEVRAERYRELFHPRPGAVVTLRWLREHGFRTALVSMCAPDTPALWLASPMADAIDELVFSSEVGLRKPDPQIYLLACDRLGVEPEACLYVGDGAYAELSGASAVGMHPVLIRDLEERGVVMLRPGTEAWDGPTITALTQVRDLVAEDDP